MSGKSTLSELYLGSEPTSVTTVDDQLLVTLADGRHIFVPLVLIGQLHPDEILPKETEFIVMRSPPQIDRVEVTNESLNVYLKDGRLISCPLTWFPRLVHGTAAERNRYELSGDDDVLHWPDLDEDIEVSRLLAGGKSMESERSVDRWLRSRQHVTAQAALPQPD